ncbi:MAG: DUF1810 domain-containing protein [Rhizomicrobium sp.]
MSRSDPFNLQRFVDAQDPVYENVLAELRQGCKQSHWMWFVFPQIVGLGRSAMAQKFAIRSLDEARAYLGHMVLGPRLIECTRLVMDIDGKTIDQIFGAPDDRKFHSSMTLFAQAGTGIFQDAIRKYFHGEYDPATLAALRNGP